MARTVKEFPAKDRRGSPYDKYFDGRIWEFIQHADFDGDAIKFAHRLRQNAYYAGYRVKMRVYDNSVVFQVIGIKE